MVNKSLRELSLDVNSSLVMSKASGHDVLSTLVFQAAHRSKIEAHLLTWGTLQLMMQQMDVDVLEAHNLLVVKISFRGTGSQAWKARSSMRHYADMNLYKAFWQTVTA